MELTVGQTLFVHLNGVHECTITKVGNKWIQTTLSERQNVDKHTLKYTDPKYCQHNYQLYTSAAELVALLESAGLLEGIRKFFQSNEKKRLSLGQLSSIYRIINEV